MKSDPIPLVCLAALALMVGAVVSHWSGIDDRIELARLGNGAEQAAPSEAAMIAVEQVVPQRAVETPPGQWAVRPASTMSPEMNQRMVRALEEFEQLQRENRNLRDQVAETNRDLMELQFRVDTHSESFRPLPATQPDDHLQLMPGVLPPRETP